MGYGLVGIVAWAQKFYILSQLNIFYMPSTFQQLGESFKWSMLDFGWALGANPDLNVTYGTRG